MSMTPPVTETGAKRIRVLVAGNGARAGHHSLGAAQRYYWPDLDRGWPQYSLFLESQWITKSMADFSLRWPARTVVRRRHGHAIAVHLSACHFNLSAERCGDCACGIAGGRMPRGD